MMVSYSRSWTIGLFGLIMLILLSCSGGSGNPLAPPTAPENSAAGDADPGLTSNADPGGQNQGQSHSAQGTALWGIYDITYDPEVGKFVVLPIRNAQFTFNITEYLQPPSGDIANLSVDITDATHLHDEGKLTIEIEITHPFPSPRLVGFDTMGVLIGDGSITYNEDPDVVFAGSEDLHLLNPDGYTRWMNPVEFTDSGFNGFTEGIYGTPGETWTASVNPYKYFAEGIGVTQNTDEYLNGPFSTSARGGFLPETSITREYQIQFPMVGGSPVIRFQYTILSHFKGAKDGGEPIPDPEISDFPPEANAPEAVCLVSDTSGSTLYYDEINSAGGGALSLDIIVFDWQGMPGLGGTGVFDEISSVGLYSPSGLFGPAGINLDINNAAITEAPTSIPHSTQLNIYMEGLSIDTVGENEILIAVYSSDPDNYGPGFGSAYPTDASLAAFTRTIVLVDDSIENQSPVIDEMQGPTMVNCFDTAAEYICVAHDPDPGDTLTYKWEVVELMSFPLFMDPISEESSVIIDWSDDVEYPSGSWQVWCQVSDSEYKAIDMVDVMKNPSGLLVDPITADMDDTINVFCTNTDALYEVSALSCNPDALLVYKWIRGFGTPPAEIDPMDPNWSFPSEDNFVVYSWDMTDIGDWWIVAQVMDDMGARENSPPYIVQRVDTPPTDANPPDGATEVDCDSTAEEYLLTGGVDCDGGDFERQWTITDNDQQPSAGWVNAADDSFIIDWSVYPVGTYYAWQRVGTDPNYSYSDPLAIARLNTEPDTPDTPDGPHGVDCTYVNAQYDAGTVYDCEGDPLTRQWALGTDGLIPPETGWISFTGTDFIVDYSLVPSGNFFLYQRASDDDINWVYSPGMGVAKFNSPPDQPPVPDGPASVTCSDTAALYDAGVATDCDIGDVLTRSYNVSLNPDFSGDDWTEFASTSFTIDWSEYHSTTWYIYQKATDGIMENISLPLEVIKGNSPPVVGPPSGPADVDCTSEDAEYFETEVSDCDPDTFLFKRWYLSTDPVTPTGGDWILYENESFFINFTPLASGEYYLFLAVSDSQDETISTPFNITRHNTAPDKPAAPIGPSEVDCTSNPAIYNGGEVTDCDMADHLTRYHYISTDSITPTGGTWTEDFGSVFMVDFNGVTAEQTYYLFQKASDGYVEVISDSVAVVYHNTAPEDPMHPAGATDVSCANDNEQYFGGDVVDCDTWQTFTRSWAVSDTDWPPAIGWTEFSGSSWFIDWSLFDEGTYYVFQRAYDGFEYAYSTSLQVTVGPPTLIIPDTPSGTQDLYCDGALETYDAGEYITGCPGADIIRDWGFNKVPSPPTSGWVVFTGTTFDVNPADLGFGYVYLFQRARLDAQEEISEPLMVYVHPGWLGIPPVPSGPSTVDCLSIADEYEMGVVSAACPDTPMERAWQVQTTSGSPLVDWQPFIDSPVIINWAIFPAGDTYHLVQRADDSEHIQISNPLVVNFVNDDPEFLGSITGPTDVTCMNMAAVYDGGEVEDCNHLQVLTREWALNTVDTYPVTGWTAMMGSEFIIDYSSPDILPGDLYLFQRVDDGVVTVYDPVSLHVVYTNTAPIQPIPVSGANVITCFNLLETYNGGEVFDCDGQSLSREWAMGDTTTPPTIGWNPFIGTTFDINWGNFDFGTHFLFQRVSDGEAMSTSDSFLVFYKNTPPIISEFACDEGNGPFHTDGSTTGLPGLDMINNLNFSFAVDDCDDDPLNNYWAVTTSDVPPDYGDPAWNGPIAGDTFSVDLSDFTAFAPSTLYVHFISYDGYKFASLVNAADIEMWDFVWMTDFANIGEMWNEHACLSGVGSYTWNYDAGNDYLRLEDYGSSSLSGVWSDAVVFPSKPAMNARASLYSYFNPALASGFDNAAFSFMNDSSCELDSLDIILGGGCDANSPQLGEFTVSSDLTIWGNSRRIGLVQNGLDGCGSSDFWVDWAGIWIRPLD